MLPCFVNARLQLLHFHFLILLLSSISAVLLVACNLSLLTELKWGLSTYLVFVLTCSEKLPGTEQPLFCKADPHTLLFPLLNSTSFAAHRNFIMSFGFGMSDVLMLVQLAYTTFDGAK
jgi:hypothetical protein